ncbi:hypothetical protein A3J90_08580 [candidate division WOR-1 bacterium RIFOXYC2_FULL_37_10]|uniref:SLH domain-containing protein n=1 Tax=candidate division WOR-1 bacterium RIFOXYB2_FULL_37_13 TaxID=1802579 RepID=A0A1F4SMF7_UNCSA|nr:MAG: hypothetical protein A2310_02190 [candidate division WOR-1 bacterium RIFOXYB2_FULL_37_13]OGC33032.1 MAG: hypothetical protein A3J90_08580 [candidate division WOR-1 bacterium RIFOXYC2_FULL_37_10]
MKRGFRFLSFKIKRSKMMKKGLILLVLFALALSLPASAEKFRDMGNDHWAADSVYDLVEREITNGFPDGTFRGNEKLSRYETAQFLSKMAKSIENNVKPKITDSDIERVVNKVLAKNSSLPADAVVSGQVFLNYQKNLQNTGITNNFNLSRAYLTVKKALGNNAIARVTLDGSTTTEFVKYAYVDLLNVVAIDSFTLNARIGVQPTYWSNWVDDILGLRVVSVSLMGGRYGEPTADTGVSAMGSITTNMLPKINYLATVLNGNGFNAVETDAGKDIGTRVDAEILPGITIGAGGQIEGVGNSTTGNKLANVLVAYKADVVSAYAEIGYGKGAIGYSVAGLCKLGVLDEMLTPVGVFGRVDIYDPNRSVDSDSITDISFGGYYDWNSNVKLLADYSVSTTNIATSSSAALRTQILF